MSRIDTAMRALYNTVHECSEITAEMAEVLSPILPEKALMVERATCEPAEPDVLECALVRNVNTLTQELSETNAALRHILNQQQLTERE